MHIEAQDFCFRASKITGPVATALELGARDVNGSARDCWPACHWTGIDIAPGPNVDLVADCTEFIDGTWPLVLSTEMLEHCKQPRSALQTMIECSSEWVLITCASTGRAPHSATDGGPVPDGEHYRNIAPDELDHPLLEPVLVEVHRDRGDLYALLRRA